MPTTAVLEKSRSSGISASGLMARKTKPSATSAAHSAQSNHASQEAVRRLIPRPYALVPLSLASQHHSTALPSLERYEVRYDGSSDRTSENSSSRDCLESRSVASEAWVLVAQHCNNRPSMLHFSSS